MNEDYKKYLEEVRQIIYKITGVSPSELETKEITTGITIATNRYRRLENERYFEERNALLSEAVSNGSDNND